MVAASAGRKGRPYRRAREQMFAEHGDTCDLCGHGGARTAHHVPSRLLLIAAGLNPDDSQYLRPAHGTMGREQNPCPTCGRLCNQEAGAGLSAAPRMPTSRDW